MKKFIWGLLLTLWLFLGTLLLGRWWYAHPETFPDFPQSFWLTLERLFGAKTYEDQLDIEFLVVFFYPSLLCPPSPGLYIFFIHASKQNHRLHGNDLILGCPPLYSTSCHLLFHEAYMKVRSFYI